MNVLPSDNYIGAVDRILEEMERQHMSKAELARRSGISYGNVCRVLSGKYVAITTAFIKAAAKALCVNSGWICFGDIR